MIRITSNKYFILKLLLVAWTDFSHIYNQTGKTVQSSFKILYKLHLLFFKPTLTKLPDFSWLGHVFKGSCRLLPDPDKLSHRLFLKDHLSEIFQTLPSREFWTVDHPSTFILSEHYKMSSIWCPKFSINVCFSFFIKSVLLFLIWESLIWFF